MAAEVVQASYSSFVEKLMHILNISLTNGIFFPEMNLAKVIPLHKADNTMLFSNYRPVSVLSLFQRFWNALCLTDYPVHCVKLTLVQPTWSAYQYHLVFLIWYPYSLVFLIWYPYALPYMVIQPIFMGMALLRAAMDSSLSQGPLLWRHSHMTVIVSRNTPGHERDTRQHLDNANARR